MSHTYRGLRIWLRPKSRLFEIFSQKFFCQNENVTEVQKKLFVDKHFRSSFQIFDFGLWSRNGILNKNSHKIAPLLWMISKVTQRVKLSLNLLINGFRWRFPIMGSKISPRISWANLNLKLYVLYYMVHIIIWQWYDPSDMDIWYVVHITWIISYGPIQKVPGL